MLKCKQEGWSEPEELRPFWNIREELTPLAQRSNCVMRGDRVVVPKSSQRQVLQLAHEGHPVAVRIRCREFAWWPRIDRQVEQMMRSCEPCLLSGKSHRPVPAQVQPIP